MADDNEPMGVESYNGSFPCPECGATRLLQHFTGSEDVNVDENGNIHEFVPRGRRDVQEVWCPQCDEKVWEQTSDE